MGLKRRRKIDVMEGGHQHKDKHGNVFGKTHPIKAAHEKKKTQRYHEITIGRG